MQKSELANQLRQRQYKHGEIERTIIDALTDDAIIDCYITCSGCWQKQVDESHLPSVIEQASDVDHFFKLCDEHAANHQSMHAIPVN